MTCLEAACGYGLNEAAFHPTTLTYWRRRLAASPDPHRVMKAIAEVVAETAVLKGKRRRAVDSTVLDDAVARQDTVTQLIAGVRRFGREVLGGKELLAAHARGYDYTRAGKPDISGQRSAEPVNAGCRCLGEAFGGENWGVDSVHTSGLGLGLTGAGLGRIPYLSEGVQCLQGLEPGSSPTSGTVFPQVRGFLVPFSCAHCAHSRL